MSNFKNDREAVSIRWHIVLGIIPALFLGACAQEASAPSSDRLETVTAGLVNYETGEIREVAVAIDMAAVETAIEDSAVEKAGCTHIRFCSSTFNGHPNTVVCDTNDQGCSSSSAFSECNGDARAVCGRTRPMGFDPSLTCPIAGVSPCPAGFGVSWLN